MNNALVKFSNTISWLVISGMAAVFVGAIVFISSRGDLNQLGLAFGGLLVYVGSALIGLAISAALLRQTALVIVEGLSRALSSAATPVASTTVQNDDDERLSAAIGSRN